MEEVIEYIQYLHSMIKHKPQCAGVFHLLSMRFKEAECYYNSDHVITKIGAYFYDWDGVVLDNKKYEPISEAYGDNWIVAHYKLNKKHKDGDNTEGN